LQTTISHHWEELFEKKISEVATAEDPAHDLLHFKRVVKTAKGLCEAEKAHAEIVIPSAWLHDFVIIPKNDPRRSQASKLSALAAVEYLEGIQYPGEYLQAISHAIEAHSFSANIEVKTIEASIVQDADRLDGLGAIGVARCFATAGILKRPFYSAMDPFCVERNPDDQVFTIDHFYQKLFKTAKSLKTQAGRAEGERRVKVMQRYLDDLALELGS
jgi:uncharacterized protein